MAREWRPVRLGEVADLLTGFPFKSERYVEVADAPRLLRGDNIVQGAMRWDGAKRWPLDATDDVAAYWLRAGDVVLAMDRPWIEAGLKYASVESSDLPALLVQRVARLRGRECLDTRFLKYVIGSRSFTDYVLAVQTGTAVPHISGGQIKNFEFLLPSLSEQRAIAHILGTLDAKIELTRRMNETLEATAATLFKSWFVDFNPVRAKATGGDPRLPKPLTDLFPDRFEQSEFGEIPANWKVTGLDQIARFLNGLALQKYRPMGDYSLPVIKIAQLRAGNTEGADRASADLPSEYIVNEGDVLFSWSGSLECVLWPGDRGALNQHLFKVTSPTYPKWLYYLSIHRHLDEFRSIAASKATTMGHIQRQHLSAAMVVLPPSELIGRAGEYIGPLIDAIVSNGSQSRTLTGC